MVLLATLGLSACAVGVASAATLGTAAVAYNPQAMAYTVTPSSLTGVAGDTFTLTTAMTDNANSYVSLVNGTGSVTLGGASCTADSSCRVFDVMGGGGASGSFTVVAPGTLGVRRHLNSSGTITIGTLTITAPTPAPTPAPAGPAITVTGVSPASGLTTGGEGITITGSGFSGGSTPTVSLGGTSATGVTVVSDTVITATTPARAAGTVDVSVSRDGGTGTKAGAYRYDQGYWLTVTNSQPPGTGGSTAKSTGAVRTSQLGDWGSSTATDGLFRKATAYTGYAGGINCGNRVERRSIIASLSFFSTETTWAGGPCRYAFPAGTKVAISALPSSSTSLVPLFIDDYWVGLFNTWTGSCTGTTAQCSVTMSADRTARAVWGRFAWGFIAGTAASTPVFADDGSLSYAVLTVGFVSKANAAPGTPEFAMVSTFTLGASATARDTAVRRATACRGDARLVRGRLEARCTPTPALAKALRTGQVRVITKWYLRAPRQKATYPLGQARTHLSNRRAGAVTG